VRLIKSDVICDRHKMTDLSRMKMRNTEKKPSRNKWKVKVRKKGGYEVGKLWKFKENLSSNHYLRAERIRKK
jgi:hypothetical protein